MSFANSSNFPSALKIEESSDMLCGFAEAAAKLSRMNAEALERVADSSTQTPFAAFVAPILSSNAVAAQITASGFETIAATNWLTIMASFAADGAAPAAVMPIVTAKAPKAAPKPKPVAKKPAKVAAEATPKPAKKSPPKPKAAKANGAAPKKKAAAKSDSGAVDDLTKINGIGPKTAKMLAENGVKTFSALQAMSVDEIEALIEKIGLSMTRFAPVDWIKEAKGFAASA